jgi:hypothetical protein
VQLKDSYEGVDDDAWPAFYGRADESGAQMMQLSAVSYHVRCPSFSDEFKLELPLNLRARHHLFFTFFNVTCKKTKGDKRPEKVVGYAMLPLLQDGRFVVEEQTLPVLPELRPHYLLSINQVRPATPVAHSAIRPAFFFLSLSLRAVSSLRHART